MKNIKKMSNKQKLIGGGFFLLAVITISVIIFVATRPGATNNTGTPIIVSPQLTPTDTSLDKYWVSEECNDPIGGFTDNNDQCANGSGDNCETQCCNAYDPKTVCCERTTEFKVGSYVIPVGTKFKYCNNISDIEETDYLEEESVCSIYCLPDTKRISSKASSSLIRSVYLTNPYAFRIFSFIFLLAYRASSLMKTQHHSGK